MDTSSLIKHEPVFPIMFCIKGESIICRMASGSMFGICMSPNGEAPRPVKVEGLGVGGIGGMGSRCEIGDEEVTIASEVVLGEVGVVFTGVLLPPERTT